MKRMVRARICIILFICALFCGAVPTARVYAAPAEKVCTAAIKQDGEETDSRPANGYVKKSKYKGKDVVAYAKKFLGKPYKRGGTSLTKGTDCSGFTMSIYRHFGVELKRTAREQKTQGKKVSLKKLQPGDLVFYPGHVGIYAGNGKIVHASTPRGGIKMSRWNYVKPTGARRIFE